MPFHFSEDDSINIFVPKEKQNRQGSPYLYWLCPKKITMIGIKCYKWYRGGGK